MPTLRQFGRSCFRAASNRLRFPRARFGDSTYVSPRCEVAPDAILGRECRVFESRLGGGTRLGDRVIVGHRSRLSDSLLGEGCIVETDTQLAGCRLGSHVSIHTRSVLNAVSIGPFSYVAREACLNDVSIGGFASIGPRTLLGTGDHPTDLATTAPVFYSTRGQCGAAFATADHFAERRPITLGHDVWLGAQVFVRDGVVIGDGAIVAAGAIVTADVPAYAIVGGVPAKILRYRFPEEVIRRLLDLKWWDWDAARLRSAQPWFSQPDIHAFLRHAEA